MEHSLDQKLTTDHAHSHSSGVFILNNTKDAGMAFNERSHGSHDHLARLE